MYEQIKDAVRQAAVNGEVADNEMLPSVRQLSADLFAVTAVLIRKTRLSLKTISVSAALADFSEKAADLLRKGVSKEKMINEINKL